MKKKILALAMASAMALSLLAGCGSGNDTNTNSTGSNGGTASGPQYDKVTLRLSCNGTDLGNDTRTAKLFAEKIDESPADWSLLMYSPMTSWPAAR